MAVMNLPRHDRFLQENMFLVGVIPGPREPSLHMNTFLKPLVDLKQLWKGKFLKKADGHLVLVRGALLCCGSDIPASRKLCGFVGHRATKGCSKCLVSFPTERFGDKPDYSNYFRESWKARDKDNHNKSAMEYVECKTQSEQREIERSVGVRYTALLELPYFDSPRMCTIDPMHNLLLGTAKHVIEVWKQRGVL